MAPEIRNVHTLLGGILSFLVVFRSNAAYDRYYEGQPPPSLHPEAAFLLILAFASF